MAYPPGHRESVQRRIVDSARRLFHRHGFEGVSISRIMAEAGLTHGGFYSYFPTKSALYAEAMSCFLTDPDWEHRWDGIEIDPAAADAAPQVVRAYLSTAHFEDIDHACPMIALPSDVARADAQAKQAFETVFKAMVGLLEGGLRAAPGQRRATAQALAAMCVGGMVVARASLDRAFADGLRDACLEVALELGGWAEPAVAA
jgi:TetR/AcrR family transcriptional regulator, transcriptional repressor for nem operon